MKHYHFEHFDNIAEAVDECNKKSFWDVVNIYSTGYQDEVCVVYKM